MKTSEILFTILTGIHAAALQAKRNESPWDSIIVPYLSAAIPVALWLEAAGKPVHLSHFIERRSVEEMLASEDPAVGPIFKAICVPLELALYQFPVDPVDLTGQSPEGTIPGLGFLCLRASELAVDAQRELEANSAPRTPATNLAEFASVPLQGWFKAEPRGEWQRKISPATGVKHVNGEAIETKFFENDPVFTP